MTLDINRSANLPSQFTTVSQVKDPELSKTFHSVNKEKYTTQTENMGRRRLNILNKCFELKTNTYWQNLIQGGKVWTYKPLDLHYCIVPKVGCTFWKRIMRFLAQDYPSDQNITRPFDIDRTFVHYGKVQNLSQNSVHNPIVRVMMMSGKSFMFSREPFSRLWSAYIDKFLLPDFWRSEAHAIIKLPRPNGTEFERSCANNVTFYEFMKYINLTAKSGLNEHWEKIHRICSPCHVKYDVIGKLETFSLDANYILTEFGLDYLKENITRHDMMREEIATLTNYNFNLESKIRKGCFDKIEVARRLWITFQYNGYIHRNISFPKGRLLTDMFLKKPQKIYTDLVLETLEQQNKLGYVLESQKRIMMLEAYRSIPKNLLSDIAKVYEYDFELFGYDKNIF